MQNSSTIFLNNLTQIDYAFINPKTNILVRRKFKPFS